MTSTRSRFAAIFVLLLAAVLGFGTAYRAVAQNTCTPDNCDTGDGNGQGGGAGGSGGGMGGSGGSGSGNNPGQTGEPSGGNGSSGAGTGGNGSSGSAGGNNIRTPTPPPEPASNSSSGSGSSSSNPTSSSGSATPAPNASVTGTSKQLDTTSQEVQSWFGVYSTNDTIGGEAKAITVHPDDEVTIFDGATTAEAQGTGDGSTLRMGIHGVADTRTKGGDGVDISMHSDAVPLGSTVTDAGGAFTANVRIPHDATAGRHFIVALAPNIKLGRVAFIFPVSVETSAAAAAAAAVVPSDQTRTGSRFPWLLVELIVGSVSVVALFVYRVRRANGA
jgi:hypothetical protein